MATRRRHRLLATRRILAGASHDTVGTVLARARSEPVELASVAFVVGQDRQLIGGTRLEALLAASHEARLAELVETDWPAVRPGDDAEHVASIAVHRGVAAVAVVDRDGRLVGGIGPEALLATLRHEHVEDLHRLAGIQRETARTREALEAPPARRARHRLPWLAVGLGGSMVAAALVARFEGVLAERMAIAFFVPAIVYLADAIGTQTEAIVVRGLSLSRRSLRSLLGGELRTGLLIGLVLGCLAVPLVALFFGDPALGAAVGVAIFLAGGVATSVGLILPWTLQRLGSDPALGSGPVATIVQDLLSLLIYLGAAALIL